MRDSQRLLLAVFVLLVPLLLGTGDPNNCGSNRDVP